MQPIERRSLRIGSRLFRYLEAEPHPGPARGVLLLLHAFPLNARMWEPQVPLVAAGWRIVAQLRQFDDGHGDPVAASMDDYAADVVDLLGASQIPGVIVGGLSIGRYVAFALMRRARSSCARSFSPTPDLRQIRRRVWMDGNR